MFGGNTAKRLIGRRAERASIARFIQAAQSRPVAMILAGEAGIGKTALWEWGLHAGRERGYRVLAAQASRSEAKLSYSGIDDLLEPVLEESLPAIREPRRRALEIALLRRRPRGHSPDRWAVAKSVLDVLRLIADRGPLVVGIEMSNGWIGHQPRYSPSAFGAFGTSVSECSSPFGAEERRRRHSRSIGRSRGTVSGRSSSGRWIATRSSASSDQRLAWGCLSHSWSGCTRHRGVIPSSPWSWRGRSFVGGWMHSLPKTDWESHTPFEMPSPRDWRLSRAIHGVFSSTPRR